MKIKIVNIKCMNDSNQNAKLKQKFFSEIKNEKNNIQMRTWSVMYRNRLKDEECESNDVKLEM